jgi:hypothetical protein
MKTNTNSIDSLIDEDHFSFGETNGGLHRQVRLPLRGGGSGTIPPGLVAGEGTLYTKTSGETSLFYTPDASTDEYQLTRTITASKAQFATNTNYAPIVANRLGGWTFLPGGMMLQYGIADVAAKGSATTIVYPTAFTGVPFSITIGSITGEGNNPSANNQFVKDGTVTNSQFEVVNSSSSSNRKIYWMAIGV